MDQIPQGPFNLPTFSAGFRTEFASLSTKFNPFNKDLIALSTGENFGIAGRGRLHILRLLNTGGMQVVNSADEIDAIFDVSWSEELENLIAYSTGKGTLKLFDLKLNKTVKTIQDQAKEIYSVEFSHKNLNWLLASGMEGVINLVDVAKGTRVNSFTKHFGCCYTATWHPTNDKLFASCGADGFLRLWDVTSQTRDKSLVMLRAHEAEVLCCDFNKYAEQIVTAGSDNSLRVWDLRKMQTPLQVLNGHRYAVRKVKCSPHEGNIIASASYDMNVNIWNLEDTKDPLKFVHKQHTEFCSGIDFNLYNKRQVASSSWDGRLLVWNWDQVQPTIK